MGCYDDSNTRKFIIFSKNTKLLAKIQKSFATTKQDVACQPLKQLKAEHLCFSEIAGHPRYTRKKLAPAMREAMSIQ